ncbi:hypothetical protein MMC13_002276, partial [Lambiella insularis]|nr:hypothetical protein [Lambiella insularis]
TKRSFSGNATEKFTIPVPGLVDNAAQGVRRGKFTMQGSDIVNVFAPVLREIIALVKGQISSTKRDVKAVLLVGGFGQSAYLRNSLRAALGPSTAVLAPPNGWTAVVRGALMKGLADGAPNLTRVTVDSRSARKHYGADSRVNYDKRIHEKSR